MIEKYAEKCLLDAYKIKSDGREKDTEASIHVSSLIDFCAREYAMCHDLKIPFYDRGYIPARTGFTFDLGKKIQDIVTERYAMVKVLYGTWKCESCKQRHIGIGSRMVIKCPDCGGSAKYCDTRLVIPKEKYGIRVVGNIDLMLAYSLPGTAFIMECKSIKTEGFMELDQPMRDNEVQTMLYPFVLSIGGEFEGKQVKPMKVDTKNAVIVYISKGLPRKNDKGGLNPWKFYEVRANKLVLDPIKEKLEEIKRWTRTKKNPNRVCPHHGARLASKCAVRKQCWGLK